MNLDFDVPNAEGETPLFDAVRAGASEVLRELLATGASVDKTCKFGTTALYLASHLGHTECAEQLLDAGASVTGASLERTPLWRAASGGHMRLAQLLCSYGAQQRGPAAASAQRHGHTELARWLLSTVNLISPLHFPAFVPPRRARALLRDGANIRAARTADAPTPLTLAQQLKASGGAPVGSTPFLVLRAAEVWSPRNHELWPHEARARAVMLLRLGFLLSRTGRFAGEEAALMDAWRQFVLPSAIGSRGSCL